MIAGGPDITGEPVTWTGRDNRAYAAARSGTGLILYTNSGGATWELRNLTAEIAGSAALVGAPTVFTTVDGVVTIAGLTASGDLALYVQTGRALAPGKFEWDFIDISQRDLAPQGLATPRFTGDVISYVTGWNGLNVAGLDENGHVQTVWWAPGLSRWSVADLTVSTGAPRLTGGLTAYLTPWGGINLAGMDEGGGLSVTWWVPGFAGEWRNTNLTDETGGPQFNPGSVASYVTSWGGLNVVGVEKDTGKLTVYWWSPALTAAGWQITSLSDTVPGAAQPEGRLTGVTLGDTISVVGADPDGHVLRYHWTVGGEWTAEDITTRVGG